MPNVLNPNDINDDFHDRTGTRIRYDEYKPTKVPNRRYEEVRISEDGKNLKLIDKNQRDDLSLITGEHVEYHGKEYFEIRYTWSKNKRKGYLTYLFEIMIYDMNKIILSDGTHTSPGSKEFWNSHINRNKFDVYRYDLDSNYKRNAKRFRTDQIWGLTVEETKEIEMQKTKFEMFEGINDVIIEDDFAQNWDENAINPSSKSEQEMLQDYELEEIPIIEEYKNFIKRYRELKASKERIRLIAQKAT